MSILVANLPALRKRLSDYSKRQQDNVAEAMPQVALYLEGEIKSSIAGQRVEPRSVDTGQFLNSPVGTTPDRFTAQVASNVEQGIYMEFGTTKIRPRKHFGNSLSRSSDKIVQFIENKMK